MTLFLSLIFTWAYGLSLVQESKDVVCKNNDVSVLIDKRDRFIEVTDVTPSNLQKYYSQEFLDSAIILKKNNSEEYAYIQLTPKNSAILLTGYKKEFSELNCEDSGGSKTCSVNDKNLLWSPTKLSYDQLFEGHLLQNMDVRHYGVYPNDGTYFLSTSPNNTGLAVIDYGSKLDLIYGKSNLLNCSYF